MSGAHARPELLASPDWLAENLGRSEVRILDVRWRPDGTGRLAFAAGHLPNATYLDWREAFVDPDDSDTVLLLAPPDQAAAAVAGAGIGNGSTVVVYDDTASLYAARTWWSLRAYGLESVRILDGGYDAWVASGRPISHAVHQPGPAAFAPRAQLRARLTTSDLRSLVGSSGAVILDAGRPRSTGDSRGTPGAWATCREPSTFPSPSRPSRAAARFADGDTLRAIIDRAGVAGRRVVCYDASGVGAAKLAFVLALMGHEDVAVYDGGWADWGSRLDLPVDR
jgi:thiosulfate/3-mercaptopyruvate sulfurtransferase